MNATENGSSIDLTSATPDELNVCASLRKRTLPSGKSWLEVIHDAAEPNGVTVLDVIRTSVRKGEAVRARYAAIARVIEETPVKMSNCEVARAFDCDSSTVRLVRATSVKKDC